MSLINPNESDWAPLEQALPPGLRGDFMFMGYVEATNGRLVRLYKHQETRKYLNLDKDALPYAYTNHRYVMQPDLRAAIRAVFDGRDDVLCHVN